MCRYSVIALIALICFCAGPVSAKNAGQSSKKPQEAVKPSKQTTLDLAAKYIKAYESKLDFNTQQDIKAIRTKIWMSKSLQSTYDDAINGYVDALTLQLASQKNFKAIAVASAILVQSVPDSPRTTNLFGAVLHSLDKFEDSALVYQYILILTPKSELIKLNLANVYEDSKEWEKAKSLADSVVAENSECKAAHKVLAHYWYEKKNMSFFGDELVKSSTFKGFVRNKLSKKNKKIKEAEAQEEDTAETLEQKVKEVKDVVPTTTADIIEDDFPAEAEKIRDRYCKLAGDEQFILPLLPQCNTNDPKAYRQSAPILKMWVKVFYTNAAKVEAAHLGVNINASEEVIHAQGKAVAKKQMTEGMQNAQDMLKYMQNLNVKGMNGTQKAKINEALKQLKQVSKEQGVNLEDKPVDMSKIPGFDWGSQIVIKNYQDYMKIERTYEQYFTKYFDKKYRGEADDISRVYLQKVQEEDRYHDQKMEELKKEHDTIGHGDKDIPCRKEILRHKKKLNEIGLASYQRWVNLYMPEYTQKMKPTIDAYYKTCMLYVKNMNDPKVMEREFYKVRQIHMFYATRAASLVLEGGQYQYVGETDEEEEQLRQDEIAAEKEAKEKKPELEAKFKEPEFDLSKWLEDHLVMEVSCEFLSLKINSKSIEFEAWAFGPGAGIKYDWTAQVMETYTGVGAKFEIGVNVAGAELKTEAKGDFIRKTAKWDFANGTYEESYGAKGEIKVTAADLLSVGGEMTVNTQIEAKIAGKIQIEGAGYVEAEQEF